MGVAVEVVVAGVVEAPEVDVAVLVLVVLLDPEPVVEVVLLLAGTVGVTDNSGLLPLQAFPALVKAACFNCLLF